MVHVHASYMTVWTVVCVPRQQDESKRLAEAVAQDFWWAFMTVRLVPS